MSEDNPARPAPGTALCGLDRIRPNSAIALYFAHGDARFSLIVARTGGDVVAAYENLCPHAHSPLERPDGRVVVQQQRYIICAAHGASFRLKDGRCVAGPGLGGALSSVPVTVMGGVVYCA
jgi:nitrite reductase/ring-hydroxylating ferredoxin subunit